MKIRIKFTKTGALRYIGHLDVMRYFQKLNRRAGIPVAYSEGFSPHQILSFSPPLSLGAESLGEYADIEITESVPSEDAVRRLNEQTVDGIQILSFKQLPEKSLNAMASVTAAKYRCSLKNTIDNPSELIPAFISLMESDEILVLKKTKKSEKTVNIRPLIYSWNILDDGKQSIELLISAGSVDNLKPELVYKAVYDKLGLDLPDNAINIIRVDLYCDIDGVRTSLDDVGEVII